jgi:hypothetical protein
VSDLTPLKEVKLKALEIKSTRVTDLSPLRGIPTLETINGQPAAQFWKEVDGAPEQASTPHQAGDPLASHGGTAKVVWALDIRPSPPAE